MSTSGRRIVVAIDVHRPPETAIDAAAGLARMLDASLAALYIEDLDLLHSAALPFTREISPILSGPQPLEPAEIASSLARDVARMQQRVAAAAARLQLELAFEVARGRLIGEIVAYRGEPEVLFVGAVGSPTATTRPGPVLVIGTRSASGERSMTIARQLATSGRAIEVFWSDAQQADLATTLRTPRPAIIVIPADTPLDVRAELVRLVRMSGCGFVLNA